MGFSFLTGRWDIVNRRRNDDGGWDEFPATSTVEPLHLDGRVQLDHYDAPDFPGRGHVRAMTVRALDPRTGEWSIVWLSTYGAPDFRPMVGRWEGDRGAFFQTITDDDGARLDVRFHWERDGDDRALWKQAFSRDGGATWDWNWEMRMTRAAAA